MTDRRRRFIDMGLIIIALVALVVPAVLRDSDQDQRADDQDQLIADQARRNSFQAAQIASNDAVAADNAEIIERLEALVTQLEDARVASELRACLALNGANVETRALATSITDGIVGYLAQSPHAPATIQVVRDDLLNRIAVAVARDKDCDHSGVVDGADYP